MPIKVRINEKEIEVKPEKVSKASLAGIVLGALVILLPPIRNFAMAILAGKASHDIIQRYEEEEAKKA